MRSSTASVTIVIVRTLSETKNAGRESVTGAVSGADQAVQLGAALRLAYCQPRVQAFFNFLLVDEPSLGRWQSGLLWANWKRKPAFAAYRAAIGEVRAGTVQCEAPGSVRSDDDAPEDGVAVCYPPARQWTGSDPRDAHWLAVRAARRIRDPAGARRRGETRPLPVELVEQRTAKVHERWGWSVEHSEEALPVVRRECDEHAAVHDGVEEDPGRVVQAVSG
jgi:hypothetical protein